MATQTQIFDLRLKIADPPGFIAFVSVADSTALPSTPASQTAYKQLDTGEYKATEKTSGATATDYDVQELRISDTKLGTLIDTYGEDSAACRAIKNIIAQLGNEMMIKKNDAGADSTEYTSLKDMLSFYKDLLSICSETASSDAGTNTGRYFTTNIPYVAGGNL